MKIQKQRLLGVMLLSMGSLTLEVVLTRIFSVTMWYHFAFLAISLALMGSATAGVFLYLFPQFLKPDRAKRWIGWISTALALCVPLTFVLYLNIPFDPVLMNRVGWFSGEQFFWLVLIYLDLSLPFFLVGMVMSLALSVWAEDAGRIYWADLTGASLGCLLSIVVLQTLGGASAVLAIGMVLALAGLAFTNGWVPRRPAQAVPLVSFGLLMVLLVSNVLSPWLRITVNKLGGQEQTPIYERWNAHSRVTVYEPVNYPFFWAIGPESWDEVIARGGSFEHALLLIDAVAGTPIQRFDGNLHHVDFLRYDVTSFAYHLIREPKTLVIGPGGGRDVLAALVTDAPHVTAVEVNPAVIRAVTEDFNEFAGYLYERPDVEVVVADARGYIDRSPERYDVIQASLIDTWAAGGSGAFALSENSLYTREAFQTYYEHLTDRGILTVSRWYLPERPAETLRLLATGMAGWRAAGIADPRQHVAVVALSHSGASTEGLSTALFKHAPFTSEEIAILQERAEALGFDVIYAPGLTPYEEVGDFITAADHDAFIADYPLDISPATDNRPFFFNLILLGDLFGPELSGSGVSRTSMEAIVILFSVIGVGIFLSAVFILLPLWIGSRRKNLPRPSPAVLAYFAALGIAFMVVEIPTIQKLTVYLGRPVYSLAVVLFSLLLSSGLGSLWSSRWSLEDIPRRMRQIFPILVGLILLHTLVSADILRWTLAFSLEWRIAVAVGLLMILGFLMGIPFPVGVRWAGIRQPGVVPWLWGINGVMSVVGSALATALSIHLGFRATIFISAIVYALAGIFLTLETRAAALPTPQK